MVAPISFSWGPPGLGWTHLLPLGTFRIVAGPISFCWGPSGLWRDPFHTVGTFRIRSVASLIFYCWGPSGLWRDPSQTCAELHACARLGAPEAGTTCFRLPLYVLVQTWVVASASGSSPQRRSADDLRNFVATHRQRAPEGSGDGRPGLARRSSGAAMLRDACSRRIHSRMAGQVPLQDMREHRSGANENRIKATNKCNLSLRRVGH